MITRDQWLDHCAKTFDEHPQTKADADGVLCFPLAAHASLSKALTKQLAKPNEAEAWIKTFAETGAPPQALRVAELEALQAALTEAATKLDVLAEQQAAMPAEGRYPDWMDNKNYMGGEGRTVAGAKARLAAAVKANEKQRKYARARLASLTPIVVKEITPELVATRSQYDALAQKMAAEEAVALEALRARLEEWNKAAAEEAGGGKATQRLTDEASQAFFQKSASVLGEDDDLGGARQLAPGWHARWPLGLRPSRFSRSLVGSVGRYRWKARGARIPKIESVGDFQNKKNLIKFLS